MVSTSALIAALQGQFSAARQGQGGGSAARLPGLLASGQGESGSGINALTGGGISGGGVPTTATTGQSIIAGGGGGFADPVRQQVLQSLADREPGERGDLGAGVTGGDVNTLLSILSGPGALVSILGSLVASAELGLPPATSINSLIESSGGSNEAFNQSVQIGREIGGPLGGPLSTGTIGGGGSVGPFRSGSPSSEEIDRGSGSSPNRGTISNAGR